jgi:hypothetical protein
LLPVTDDWEIVAPAFPRLEMVAGSVAVVPTVTFPKLSLAGLTDKFAAVTPTPVPLSGTRAAARRLPDVLKVSEADTLPAAVGANVTLTVTLLPGAMFFGTVNPLVRNAGELGMTLARVSVCPLAFFTVKVLLELSPIWTLP